MALQDAIKRLRYVFTSEGAEKLASDIQKVNQSQATTEKSSLSLEQSFAKLERRFVDGVKAQQDYQKIQTQVNAAVAQNPALQERANAVLAAASSRFDQATTAQKAFATATSGVSGQLIALSAGAGPVGVFLSALGPLGLAASIGIGAVTAAFAHMKEEAGRVGDKSVEVKKFADVTGLSIEQIRGLGKVGKEFGVGSDELATSVERFTVNLEAARRGSGDLYEKIRAINPALANELAGSRSTAEGWDAYAQALKRANDAGDVAQRNALARAGFGKGGLETGLVAARSADLGGVDVIAAKTRQASGITGEWVEKTAQLRRENEQIEKQIADMKANAYAQEVLERQNQFLKAQRQITQEMLKAGEGGFIGRLAQLVAPYELAGKNKPSPEDSLTEKQKAQVAADRASGHDVKVTDTEIITTLKSQTKDAIAPIDELRNALAKSAADIGAASSALGQYGSQADKVRQQQLALTEAFLSGTINDQQYARANDALTAQGTLLDNLRAKYGGVSDALNLQADALARQLPVASAITGQQQINAQYSATVAQLYQQTNDLAGSIAVADQQRAVSLAQVNAEADRQLKTLQQQGELLQAASQFDKDRIAAAQTYQNLLDKGVDSAKARAVAGQQLRNADLNRQAQETADADREAATAAQQKSQANQAAAAAAEREAQAAEEVVRRWRQLAQELKFLPLFLRDIQGGMDNLFNSNQGGKSQFNPKGYQTKQLTPAAVIGQQIYGPGGLDQQTGAPNAQGMQYYFDSLLRRSGGDTAAVASDLLSSGLTTQGALGTTPRLDTNKVNILNRAIDVLSGDQQSGLIRQEIGALQGAPQSLETSELIKQLNDKLQQLTQATQDNTQATQTITDVLSPFYSQDPRSTHLGFRAFAGGGIMTPYGELPLRKYDGGGVAYTPQAAIYAENSVPEAYVPVPSGRIPVELRGAANSNTPAQPIIVHVSMTANVSRDEARKTGFQIAQEMKRRLG